MFKERGESARAAAALVSVSLSATLLFILCAAPCTPAELPSAESPALLKLAVEAPLESVRKAVLEVARDWGRVLAEDPRSSFLSFQASHRTLGIKIYVNVFLRRSESGSGTLIYCAAHSDIEEVVAFNEDYLEQVRRVLEGTE